ncbi:MAG: hypothetical protein QM790_06935 [Nibricoccus sp.]
MTNLSTFANPAAERPNPTVVLVSDAPATSEALQLDIACRFYGFDTRLVSSAQSSESFIAAPDTILVAVHASVLAQGSDSFWDNLSRLAKERGVPTAIIGIDAGCEKAIGRAMGLPFQIQSTAAGMSAGLYCAATEPHQIGYELRDVRLAIRSGAVPQLRVENSDAVRIICQVGIDDSARLPSYIEVIKDGGKVSLLARTAPAEPNVLWRYDPGYFAELAPFLMLVRGAGGARCWLPAQHLANLTIDDPWLTEPYGSLSYHGLLREMKNERFHATIGHIPWNYQRYKADVVTLFQENPDYFSLAVHGNNHDRYEFFRYEARPGDQQHPKPKHLQELNISQAMARMERFEEASGLSFDRVMVFPHGICPGPSIELLKKNGFWATFNYHNVPLDEAPPSDPAYALRSVYTKWFGFPTFRRNYPHNYVEPLIAIDLFLGNPTLFMAHQDTFFEGIDAFTQVARRVNTRQPGVKWTHLGEITRRYYLVRWFKESVCEVRLFARHATFENPKDVPVHVSASKFEPSPADVSLVTLDGAEIQWTSDAENVFFAAEVQPLATAYFEVHYKTSGNSPKPSLKRTGLRNYALRAIADFRDLVLPRSFLGRLLTRKYYRPGKKRPTIGGMLSRAFQLFRRS